MDPIPLSLPILLDGATGTQLQKRGMPAGACTETWVLEHPDTLLELQRAYVEAGSQVLLAPTFGANRTSLARSGVTQVEEYNKSGTETLYMILEQNGGGLATEKGRFEAGNGWNSEKRGFEPLQSC